MGAGASSQAKADGAALFAAIDKDRNGRLSVEELVTATQEHGAEMQVAWPLAAIESAVKKYDRDDDGQLDKKEFQKATNPNQIGRKGLPTFFGL